MSLRRRWQQPGVYWTILWYSMPSKFTKFDFPPQKRDAFSCNGPTSLNLNGDLPMETLMTHDLPWPTDINCIKCWTVWSNWNPRCAAVRSCRTSQWWQGAIWLDLPMITVSFKCWEVYFPETHETSEKIRRSKISHIFKNSACIKKTHWYLPAVERFLQSTGRKRHTNML